MKVQQSKYTLNNYPIYLSGTSYTYYWGKASREEDVVTIQQSPVTCKDYVVDTHFRASTSGCPLNKLTIAERMSPCFYILPHTNEQMAYMQQHIKEVLNPWELKHGFMPTTCTVADRKDIDTKLRLPQQTNLLIFDYDSQWMTNSSIFSFYMSIVRMAMLCGELNFKCKIPIVHCNELQYYSDLHTEGRKFMDFLLDNPRYLIDNSDLADVKGVMKGETWQAAHHGCTGFFYLLTIKKSQQLYPNDYSEEGYNTLFKGSWINHLYTKWLDEQPKKRAAKKPAIPRKKNLTENHRFDLELERLVNGVPMQELRPQTL